MNTYDNNNKYMPFSLFVLCACELLNDFHRSVHVQSIWQVNRISEQRKCVKYTHKQQELCLWKNRKLINIFIFVEKKFNRNKIREFRLRINFASDLSVEISGKIFQKRNKKIA